MTATAPGFLTANGQRDSHAVTLADGRCNASPRAGQPYGRISWQGIAELVANPAAQTKDRAALVILSTYAEHDGRTHQVQRDRGCYGGLAVDIDKGDPSIEQVVEALRKAVGEVAAYIYSSSSAEPGHRKWRILLPLTEPIAGSEYADTQNALFGLLANRGIVCDPTLARSAQPVFLPNVPPNRRAEDGRPFFYQSAVLDGPRLTLAPGSPVADARAALRERRAAEEREAAKVAAANRKQRLAVIAATGDDFDPIEHFKQNHTVGQLLALYGFERSPRQRGSHWKSPLSSSGSYSTEDRGDHWVAVSAWAHDHNVGRVSSTGHRYGDAFDLYVAFEHNGDKSAAVRAYAELARPQRPAAKQKPAAVRIEHIEHDNTEVVPLGEFRERIALAVKQAVQTKGVHLNTAGTGCGKTFATAKAVASLARSVTSAPTHALCEERAAELRSFGADAAAYPPLDEHTCENYGEASRVQAAGLSPGRVLCHGCPFRTSCETSGYLARVKAADKARHKVVTHARLARSAKVVCKGAECIVLEEEPTAAVRPSIAASRQEMVRAGDFARVVYRRLRDDDEPAVEVDLTEIGFSDPDYGLPTGDDAGFADFAAWSLPPESPATEPQKERPQDVVNGPRRRVRALIAKRLHKAAFFRHVADVARYLQVEAKAAMRKGSGVYVVPMPAPVKPPKNIDGIVWPSLAESSEPPTADSLRLVVAAASGGLNTLVVQVDANERYAKSHPDAKPLLRARVIGLWQTALPYSRVPVVINDGTNDAVTVRAIVGREVNDITPPGRVPLQHPCVQYAADVKIGTSPQVVANIVCGLARAHADKSRLGVILLKTHRDKLLPEGLVHGVPRRGRKPAAMLPMPIRHRIEWHTHFNSGLDRGSNDMHTQVDLALVIGTFRPPPSEVRRRLIEMGMVAEAHTGGEWGVIERHGRQPNGEPIAFQGLGYASDAWRLAAESLTRAAVRQAIGRARANTAAGVPVVAVTTENTGLPILPGKALPRSCPEIEQLVEAITCTPEHRCTTGATFPSSSNRKSGPSCTLLIGCSLSSIRANLPRVPRRTLKRWIKTAVESGAVIRTGQTTKTRYTLPTAPQPAKQEPPPSDGTCPSCGSDEHRDSVSSDGQIGRRCCAECGAFITFTIWHGKPVLPPAVPSQPASPHGVELPSKETANALCMGAGRAL